MTDNHRKVAVHRNYPATHLHSLLGVWPEEPCSGNVIDIACTFCITSKYLTLAWVAWKNIVTNDKRTGSCPLETHNLIAVGETYEQNDSNEPQQKTILF